MTQLTYPFPDFVPHTTAKADDIDANFAAIQTVVNGGVDDTNVTNDGITASTKIKDGTIDAAALGGQSVLNAAIDFRSASLGVKTWQDGPTYPGTNGGRIVRISKSITPIAAQAAEEYTFTFANDSVDGDPAFTSAPMLTGVSFVRSTTNDTKMPATCYFKSVTTTQGVLRVVYGSGTSEAVAMTVSFLAAGAI